MSDHLIGGARATQPAGGGFDLVGLFVAPGHRHHVERNLDFQKSAVNPLNGPHAECLAAAIRAQVSSARGLFCAPRAGTPRLMCPIE